MHKFFAVFKHLIYLEKVDLFFGDFIRSITFREEKIWNYYLSYLPRIKDSNFLSW